MNPESSLLATKLFVPQLRPSRVPRPRLLARLSPELGGNLILISAPVGFGKTTLVSEWLQQGQRPFAWLSLDEGDNDSTRFLAYLGAALGKIRGHWGQVIQGALQAPQPASPQTVIAALINEIATSELDLVLALDDYHAVSNPAIHEMLAFLLDNLPPTMHLILVTRADPPLPLARLRARGHLTEIRAEDLRFTAEEAAAFLNQVMGLDLTAQQVAILETRTEGWIAGLQLAALSLQGLGLGEQVAAFIKAFAGSHRYVMDYLVEEVFNRQPPEVQEFLLQTSVLDRLSGPLCDAVVERDAIPPHSSQEMLEWLDRANLFTTPLDHERRWYRYHHLFADLLRDRLRQSHPDRVPELRRRAANWCERNGLMEDAVQYALQAKDFDLATSLIEQITDALWERSEVGTVLSWMKAMPEELVHSQPRLCHIYASALANTGYLDSVEPLLQAIEVHLREGQSLPEALSPLPDAHEVPGTPTSDKEWRYRAPQGVRAMVDIRRAFVMRFYGSPSEAIAFGAQALDRIPPGNSFLRGMALLFQGHGYLLAGSTEAANKALIGASAAGQAAGHIAVYLSAINYLGQLRVLQGRLGEAMAIYQQAAQLVAGRKGPVFAGIEHIGIGDLQREWDSLEEAVHHIRQGVRLAELGGDFVFLRDAYIACARLEQAVGNPASALAFIEKAEQVVRRHQPSWDTTLVEIWRARLELMQGNSTAAEQWARKCMLSLDDKPSLLCEFGHLMLARVLLSQGRLGEARVLLQRLLPAAESAGHLGRVIEILVLRALVQQADGHIPGALASLERALHLAEPGGYVRTFTDEGMQMTALLRQALWRNIAPHYVRRLLSAMGVAVLKGVEEASGTPRILTSALVEPLTEREREILELIAAGLRNQEIADQLVISVATVKRHISNLYGKLGVSHRTQAIAQARELGLLQSPL
jgi:LuxR family maltose regulon positive regulatory protein